MAVETSTTQNSLSYSANYYQNHKEYIKNQRAILLSLIGDSCLICGSKRNLRFHKIKGEYHKYHNTSYCYYRKTPSDFVTLCQTHHYKLHNIMRLLTEYPTSERTLRLIYLLFGVDPCK
jgi:hypothetical protein